MESDSKALVPKHKMSIGNTGSFYVMNVVVNADLRIMFDGINGLMKKYLNLEAKDIEPGRAVLFVNSEGKYMKMLVGNGTNYPVIAAYRFPPGQKFPLEAVKDIAQCFKKADKVDANKTLRLAMEKWCEKKRNTSGGSHGRGKAETNKKSEKRRTHSNRVRPTQAGEGART